MSEYPKIIGDGGIEVHHDADKKGKPDNESIDLGDAPRRVKEALKKGEQRAKNGFNPFLRS